MAHRIELQLETRRRERGSPPATLTVAGGDGRIHVSGSLSAGRSGWRLTGTALRHRRRILLQVVASPAQDHMEQGLEDFLYEADLLNVPPGRYRVRINHIYYATLLGLPPDSVTRGEFSVEVGREALAQSAAVDVSDHGEW